LLAIQRSSPPPPILEMTIGELLAIVVAHAKSGGLFLDGGGGKGEVQTSKYLI
jgi:hypothetical protein